MEALRKAEEAKRIAAQKVKDSVSNESAPLPSSTPAVENLQAQKESIEENKSLDTQSALPESQKEPSVEESLEDSLVEFSFAMEEDDVVDVSPDGEANLDVPFDFQIDESFGVEAEAPKQEDPKQEAPASETSSALTLEENELSPSIQTPPEMPSNSIEFSPSVASEPPSAMVVEEAVLPEPEPAAVPQPEPELETEVKPEPQAEPTPEPEPILAVAAHEPIASHVKEHERDDALPSVKEESIRASREDDANLGTKVEQKKPPRIAQKVGLKSAADESRIRESARAVFSAKSSLKPAGQKRKLLIAASVLVLIPLAGGSYLLLNELGMLGGNDQFNIPASYVPGERSFDEVGELAVTDVEQSVLPDVSPVDAIAMLGGEEAINDALESVVTSLGPTIALNNDLEMTNPVAAPTESTEPAAATTPIIEPQQAAQAEIEEVPMMEEVQSTPITIVRSDTTPKVDPQILLAYDAYRANDFITARAHYQQALRDKPNNRDAIMGLAAVSLKMGDSDSARESYLRLLQLDPRDVLARVSLLDTMPASDPIALESELKSLFEEHPEVAHLAFSLGNMYASQGRWNEAQQSYYDALLSAKASALGVIAPDYAFNLAVSLERLNQLPAAYNFYREALTLTQGAEYAFDIRVLRERLDAIERMLP